MMKLLRFRYSPNLFIACWPRCCSSSCSSSWIPLVLHGIYSPTRPEICAHGASRRKRGPIPHTQSTNVLTSGQKTVKESVGGVCSGIGSTSQEPTRAKITTGGPIHLRRWLKQLPLALNIVCTIDMFSQLYIDRDACKIYIYIWCYKAKERERESTSLWQEIRTGIYI